MTDTALIINDKRQKPIVQSVPTKALTPAEMLSVAVQQGRELDYVEKLMDLQDRWEKSNARKAFIAALSAFRGECPAIGKDSTGHNTRYASLAGTIDQIKSLLTKHELSHTWKTRQNGDSITVECCVTHIQGHTECTSLTAGPDVTGNKNSIQAIGSTVSYLQRYTLFAILGLASKEMDTDGNTISEGVSRAIDEIIAAENMDALKTVFAKAWKAYPDDKIALTATKETRKRELMRAE